MSMPSVEVMPVGVPVRLEGRSKLQTDAIRMGLLLKYGARRLFLQPDGSAILVELLGSQRSIEVHELVDEVSTRFPDQPIS